MSRATVVVLLAFAVACLAAAASGSFIRAFHHGVGQQPPTEDCGEPLDVSALLRQGRVEDARNQSLVNPPIGGLESYSGFFTTNSDETNHMFWWYFPALNGDVNAPVVIWLQGGPGGSSMFALFSEMGPLQLNAQMQVSLNPYTWANKYAMLFIDNPVGAGFSYTDDVSGYCNDTKTCVASNLYSLMQQFYKVFPEKANVDLYITGESYAGHYVPGFAYYIHTENALGVNPKIPLRGIAVGDGWIDPATMITAYPDLMFNIGVADAKQKAVIQNYCTTTIELIIRGDMLGAFNVWDEMLNGDVYPYPNYYHNISGSNDYDNFMNTNAPVSFGYYSTYLNQPAIRQAIHSGNTPFPFDPTTCEHHLLADFMVSFKRELGVLMDHYKVLIYSGQLDVIIGAALTEAFLPTVVWSGQANYWDMDRIIWKVEDSDDQVAGYIRTVGQNFTYAVVRGAGHIVPYDQPRASLDMITRFINDQPWTN